MADQRKKLETILPDLTEIQFRQLHQFCSLVREWNRGINLVSRQDAEHLWEHHLLPSVVPLAFIQLPDDCRLLDIGSGGGFPAIPLKIMRPDLQMVLVDSVRKRNLFIRKAITDLNLKGITATNQRVEMLGSSPDMQKQFDLITARAVGSIPTLIRWGKPFLNTENRGHFLLWKGEPDIPELKKNAQELDYEFQVFSVPEAFQSFSPKFKNLRWFLVRLRNG
jgi:16S rRNA (guanine527-N7)-methyltransferase